MKRMVITAALALTPVACVTDAADYSLEADTTMEVNEPIMSEEGKIDIAPEPEPFEDTLSYPGEGYTETADEPTEEETEEIRRQFVEGM